jgi:hypothetical protein
MKASDLRVGDRIRIIGIPGAGDPNYYLHPDTKRAYTKLIARGRSVRIFKIDEYGAPWFAFRFKRKNGKWEYHWLNIYDWEDIWVPVKPRGKKKPGKKKGK